eukprot:CAMPEP_0201550304 /NCGR_PEP_ID=MMETSP0173_2-20130828/6683_1 /ASSEMBLY_ACC=CAM_ASM_000268 /TAXON_ID=218659 /ORGANISM="Vexillifera sp., Strain DIVA3 564/2" /LENGTH=148 /DNA_ID=CAMNT_0047960241 /DNA_START=310 /DNA_END=756 /DNA_ORIENTATION=+
MDGMTGGWHFLDLMNEHYIILDKRFRDDEVNSWMITQLELFVMAPLCLLTYRAIVQNKPSRYFFEVLTSTFQLIGAIFFFGAELIQGFPNTPVDRNFEFTFHHTFYFWFGYGANLLWVIFPLYFILRAFSRGKALVQQGLAFQNKKRK